MRTTQLAVGTLLAAALTLGACTTEPQPIPGLEEASAAEPAAADGSATEPVEPAPNQVSGVPIPDGQIAAAISQLDGLVGELMDSSRIPGLSLAVVHDGETVYAQGFGAANTETATSVDADTAFPLAAASPSVAATVVARALGEQGLDWDSPVRQLMPTFTVADQYVSEHATVGDLFAHRSGLPAHAGELAAGLGFDRQETLERLPYLPLEPFRASFARSNVGATAAGEAVAQAAGTDWASLAQQLDYKPLGMNSTSSRNSEFLARENRAVAHAQGAGAFTIAPDRLEPDALSPADGASSSANDMARWMTMVLGGGSAAGKQIIAPADLLPALSPQAVPAMPDAMDARAEGHGYGFDISTSATGRVQLGSPSSSAAFMLIPSTNVGVVVLTNASESWVPAALTAQFADLVQSGQQTQDWPALAREAADQAQSGEPLGTRPPSTSKPAAPLTSYDGAYANDLFGVATVSTSNDTLVLTLGPGAAEYPLRHWDGDTFTMEPPAGSTPPGGLSRVVFANGSMVIEYLDENGLGTFYRN